MPRSLPFAPSWARGLSPDLFRPNIPRMSGAVETGTGRGRTVTLPARPEPIRVSVEETAIVVIDMQNAYASKGGYVDLAGFDIEGAAGTIGQIAKVLETGRAAGVTIVYLQNGWDADYVEAGRAGLAQLAQVQRAEDDAGRGRNWPGSCWRRAAGITPWSDALAPQPGDIVLHKTRYSAFFNSQLDSTLRSRGIRNIVFVGIATNVCVESTLRDGFHLEYFGVMLEDATHHLGPPVMQQASVYNVEKFFGWVTTVADFCGTFGQIAEEGDR